MSRTTKSPLAMARAALAAAEQVVPPYSCKHSRKDFTQPQLLALLLLKQFFKIGYRDVAAWVAEWSDLREALGLTKVPHFTAIQKAGARLLKKESLESLLDATIALARERGLISDASELAAIDSTGLESRHVSTYYGQRSGRKYHRFPKLSAVVDVRSHLCLAAVIDRGPKPDDAEFRPAVRQARRRHRGSGPRRGWHLASPRPGQRPLPGPEQALGPWSSARRRRTAPHDDGKQTFDGRGRKSCIR